MLYDISELLVNVGNKDERGVMHDDLVNFQDYVEEKPFFPYFEKEGIKLSQVRKQSVLLV